MIWNLWTKFCQHIVRRGSTLSREQILTLVQESGDATSSGGAR